MRITETKIYKFEELKKEVQEKVIEKWHENENYFFLEDDLCELLKCNEKNIFEDGFSLYYSLNYCQGDGLSIEGNINIDKILDIVEEKSKNKFKDKIYELYSTGNKTRYCYANRNQIKYALDLFDDDNYDEVLLDFENEILPIIQNIYMTLCKELEKEGYEILEYRMNIEEFSEMCESNNYEFYENGEMF